MCSFNVDRWELLSMKLTSQSRTKVAEWFATQLDGENFHSRYISFLKWILSHFKFIDFKFTHVSPEINLYFAKLNLLNGIKRYFVKINTFRLKIYIFFAYLLPAIHCEKLWKALWSFLYKLKEPFNLIDNYRSAFGKKCI